MNDSLFPAVSKELIALCCTLLRHEGLVSRLLKADVTLLLLRTWPLVLVLAPELVHSGADVEKTKSAIQLTKQLHGHCLL